MLGAGDGYKTQKETVPALKDLLSGPSPAQPFHRRPSVWCSVRPLESRSLGFKSCLLILLAMPLSANHSTPLRVSFFHCKMGTFRPEAPWLPYRAVRVCTSNAPQTLRFKLFLKHTRKYPVASSNGELNTYLPTRPAHSCTGQLLMGQTTKGSPPCSPGPSIVTRIQEGLLKYLLIDLFTENPDLREVLSNQLEPWFLDPLPQSNED